MPCVRRKRQSQTRLVDVSSMIALIKTVPKRIQLMSYIIWVDCRQIVHTLRQTRGQTCLLMNHFPPQTGGQLEI
jgi:hypothetical protein